MLDLIETIPSKSFQIKKTDILTKGKYKVIDQGKKSHAGYSNNQKKVFKEIPIICFGDHTTNVKFMEEPFIVGGDGLKLIKVKKNNINLKYLFYSIENNNVMPEGYKRHFSILKNKEINIPSLYEQEKIVSFLTLIDYKIDFLIRIKNLLKYFKKGMMENIFS